MIGVSNPLSPAGLDMMPIIELTPVLAAATTTLSGATAAPGANAAPGATQFSALLGVLLQSSQPNVAVAGASAPLSPHASCDDVATPRDDDDLEPDVVPLVFLAVAPAQPVAVPRTTGAGDRPPDIVGAGEHMPAFDPAASVAATPIAPPVILATGEDAPALPLMLGAAVTLPRVEARVTLALVSSPSPNVAEVDSVDPLRVMPDAMRGSAPGSQTGTEEPARPPVLPGAPPVSPAAVSARVAAAMTPPPDVGVKRSLVITTTRVTDRHAAPELQIAVALAPQPGPLPGPLPQPAARSVMPAAPASPEPAATITTEQLGAITIGIGTGVGDDRSALRVHFAVDHVRTAEVISAATGALDRSLLASGNRLDQVTVHVPERALAPQPIDMAPDARNATRSLPGESMADSSRGQMESRNPSDGQRPGGSLSGAARAPAKTAAAARLTQDRFA